MIVVPSYQLASETIQSFHVLCSHDNRGSGAGVRGSPGLEAGVHSSISKSKKCDNSIENNDNNGFENTNNHNSNSNNTAYLNEFENSDKNEIDSYEISSGKNSRASNLIAELLQVIFEIIPGCRSPILISLLKGILICSEQPGYPGGTRVILKNTKKNGITSGLQEVILSFSKIVFYNTLQKLCLKYPYIISNMTNILDMYLPLLSLIPIEALPQALFPFIKVAGYSAGYKTFLYIIYIYTYMYIYIYICIYRYINKYVYIQALFPFIKVAGYSAGYKTFIFI
jgi:hypothetical protein